MRRDLFRLGLYLLLAGFALAFAAALLIPLAAALGGQPAGVSGAGCVLVVFVPICFGIGEAALPLMVAALAAVALLAVLSFVVLKLKPL